ncbi:hypothetical protein NS14008_03100 [Nocardia seriolae]|nr:hypothetical protein NS14008_03100 [Nocardia seriolae]PSK28499.1 hypothetical protein C6575_26235 [Nocardia seriolae]RLP32890.1 hypothetical protein D6158_04985 [Nocardia seriolae]
MTWKRLSALAARLPGAETLTVGLRTALAGRPKAMAIWLGGGCALAVRLLWNEASAVWLCGRGALAVGGGRAVRLRNRRGRLGAAGGEVEMGARVALGDGGARGRRGRVGRGGVGSRGGGLLAVRGGWALSVRSRCGGLGCGVGFAGGAFAEEAAAALGLRDDLVLREVLDRGSLVGGVGDVALGQPGREHGEAVVLATHIYPRVLDRSCWTGRSLAISGAAVPGMSVRAADFAHDRASLRA